MVKLRTAKFLFEIGKHGVVRKLPLKHFHVRFVCIVVVPVVVGPCYLALGTFGCKEICRCFKLFVATEFVSLQVIIICGVYGIIFFLPCGIIFVAE